MPQISLKKVLLLILIIILLSKLKVIITGLKVFFGTFYDAFEPLRNSPPFGKYVVALIFLALIYITIYKLLQRKQR